MNKSTFSDHELIGLIAADDTEAFKILFDQYYPTLVRVLMRYSNDTEQIKDWVQEIFIRLWEGRQQLDINHIDNFKAYFIVTARNYAIRVLSKKKKTELVFSPEMVACEIADNNLLEGLAETELRDAYQSALAKLPLKTQEAYYLNREKGLTYGKIADELGVSIKTVEAHISRTMAFLRQELVVYLR
ncbi:RNA polymerase sigma factor [Dyadobacter pollutisoli]|uniref:Sigma-70 family RNA polymerase sigma factor n=1 Tax=Dyadobacter pollutisoli TaxID=2910158 RepID=A0A9E8NCH7_9BACT|nr:sigma-70 family RNA polymerase sigma factor [Dyadobacter pollutisoli]WAC14090.1 sigma-70 family RNA polymerase sigma factor [Dyadobacter pollutisoli]